MRLQGLIFIKGKRVRRLPILLKIQYYTNLVYRLIVTDTAHLTRILLPLLFLVLIIGLLSSSPHNVFAQHGIAPENWMEMRKMFRNKGPIPTIEEDIAALAGGGGDRAAIRLIDRGPEALPAVHAALRSPEIGPLHALHLLQVMGALAEKSSVSVVLEFLKKDKKHPLRRDALYILALLPVTEESAAFIIDIANDVNEKWNTRRMAFTWFGLHRDPRGRRYAESLRSDPDPEGRAAGLFVLARLGDKSVLEPVSQMLASGPPANSRDALMFALAEITTPEEFERRAPSSLAWSRGYKESLLYARYVASGPQQKIPLCLEMLRSQTPGHRELAVRYLLKNGYANQLRPYAALDLEAPGRAALIRNEIRKAGWRIIDTDDEFNIEPSKNLRRDLGVRHN
jgi:HEAT repeat protein